MQKRKTMIRSLCAVCIATLVSLSLCSGNAFAYTTKQLQTSTAVSSITTGSKTCGDYFKISTEDSFIIAEIQHEKAYAEGLSPRLIEYPLPGNSIRKDTKVAGSVKYVSNLSGLEAGGTTTLYYDCSYFRDGTYYFRICENKKSDNYPTIFAGVKVVIKDGYVTLHKFDNISKANKKLANGTSYKKSKTKSLSDYRYQLFYKKGTTRNPRVIAETKEANYYKKVSNKIVNAAGAKTNYDKAFAIFKFVAGNFYYDNNAVKTGRIAYDDPYYNLQYQQNKTGNSYNAFKGKVALHCDGYAGIFTALARAQGIPTRMVYGHKIVQGKTSWEVETSALMKKNNHTWVQCYISGRWVNIDPQQASGNTYGSFDSASDKTWKKISSVKNYYFDISYDQFAATHKFNRLVIS